MGINSLKPKSSLGVVEQANSMAWDEHKLVRSLNVVQSFVSFAIWLWPHVASDFECVCWRQPQSSTCVGTRTFFHCIFT